MNGDYLYEVDAALVALLLFGLLLLSVEAGYRFARRRRYDEAIKSQTAAIKATIFALLSLLLAFTVSMAESRYEARKTAAIVEANAIGSAYLRTKLLPEPHRTETADLLRRYLNVRIETGLAARTQGPTSDLDDRIRRLQNELWSHAAAAAAKDPGPVTSGLFIQSLNQAIDALATRTALLKDHVPASILALISVSSILAMWTLGFGGGMEGSRSLWASVMLSALIPMVVFVILDLDRPRRGLIKVSEQVMLDLKSMMAGDAAGK